MLRNEPRGFYHRKIKWVEVRGGGGRVADKSERKEVEIAFLRERLLPPSVVKGVSSKFRTKSHSL